MPIADLCKLLDGIDGALCGCSRRLARGLAAWPARATDGAASFRAFAKDLLEHSSAAS